MFGRLKNKKPRVLRYTTLSLLPVLMRGFYKTFRSVAQELRAIPARTGTFSEVQAYQWLMDKAHFKPRRITRFGISILTKPGCVTTTMRTLSKEWGWHRSRVKPFLIRLRKMGVVSCSFYHKQLKLLLVLTNSSQTYQWGTLEKPYLSIENNRRIKKDFTDVFPPNVPTPPLAFSDIPNNSEQLTQLSPVYNKKKELDLNTKNIYPHAGTKTDLNQGDFMTDKLKPSLTLITNPLLTGCCGSQSQMSEQPSPSCAAPLKPFMKRQGEATPFPRGTDSPVLLTDHEVSKLTELLGGHGLMFQVKALAAYSEQSPKKFKAYKNHSLTIQNWHRMKIEKGLVFCHFHRDGQCYCPRWVYEQELEAYREEHSVPVEQRGTGVNKGSK
jgi:hypothetical protein